MPIQLFPQLQHRPLDLSGIPDAQQRAAIARQQALTQQDQLAIEQKQKEMGAIQAATIPGKPAMEDIGGMKVNVGNLPSEFDPEIYHKELEKINPEAALKYKEATSRVAQLDAETERAKALLNDTVQTQRLHHLVQFTNYFQTTGDKKGTLAGINRAEQQAGIPPEEWTTDIVKDKSGITIFSGDAPQGHKLDQEQLRNMGASLDNQLAQHNEMTKFFTTLEDVKKVRLQQQQEALDLKRQQQAEKEQQNKPKPAPRPNRDQLNQVMASLASSPAFEGMDKTNISAFASDIAKTTNDIIQKAINNKEEPPDQTTAMDMAMEQVSKRMLPKEERAWYQPNKPAKYFTNPEDVQTAVKKGELDVAKAAKIIKDGFPDFYSKLTGAK